MDIREIRENDINSFAAFLETLDSDNKFMMYEPGERDVSYKSITNYIKGTYERGGLLLGVFDKGEIAGYINIERKKQRRKRHIGYIVMGVLRSYTGKGLGTSLIKESFTYAKSVGITKLELSVMTHNTSAITFYEKNGFKITGTMKSSLIIDGNYVDEYYMERLL